MCDWWSPVCAGRRLATLSIQFLLDRFCQRPFDWHNRIQSHRTDSSHSMVSGEVLQYVYDANLLTGTRHPARDQVTLDRFRSKCVKFCKRAGGVSATCPRHSMYQSLHFDLREVSQMPTLALFTPSLPKITAMDRMESRLVDLA
jgi:hypothetical protein